MICKICGAEMRIVGSRKSESEGKIYRVLVHRCMNARCANGTDEETLHHIGDVVTPEPAPEPEIIPEPEITEEPAGEGEIIPGEGEAAEYHAGEEETAADISEEEAEQNII